MALVLAGAAAGCVKTRFLKNQAVKKMGKSRAMRDDWRGEGDGWVNYFTLKL